MSVTGNSAQKQGLLFRPIKGQIMPGEHLDCEVSIARAVYNGLEKSWEIKRQGVCASRSCPQEYYGLA